LVQALTAEVDAEGTGALLGPPCQRPDLLVSIPTDDVLEALAAAGTVAEGVCTPTPFGPSHVARKVAAQHTQEAKRSHAVPRELTLRTRSVESLGGITELPLSSSAETEQVHDCEHMVLAKGPFRCAAR